MRTETYCKRQLLHKNTKLDYKEFISERWLRSKTHIFLCCWYQSFLHITLSNILLHIRRSETSLDLVKTFWKPFRDLRWRKYRSSFFSFCLFCCLVTLTSTLSFDSITNYVINSFGKSETSQKYPSFGWVLTQQISLEIS